MTKICPQEKIVDAQHINMWDQKWVVWECDSKYNNVLYKDGTPLVVDSFSFMLGQNSSTAWGNHPNDVVHRWHPAVCTHFPIVAQVGSSQFKYLYYF